MHVCLRVAAKCAPQHSRFTLSKISTLLLMTFCSRKKGYEKKEQKVSATHTPPDLIINSNPGALNQGHPFLQKGRNK